MANNIIVMNRGDTYSFDLTVLDDSGDRYVLIDNDVMYMGIMDPNQPFEEALVKKRYTKDDLDEEGNLIATIDPEDTLDLIPGVYYYAAKLRMDHIDPVSLKKVEQVSTVIKNTKFIICE